MSGRHRNDIPEGSPGDGGNDPSGGGAGTPVFGPANDGSSDWFGPRQGQGPAPQPGAGAPEWLVPRPQSPSAPSPAPEEPAYGAGGFTGASDAGGYGLGRPAGGAAAGGAAAGAGGYGPGSGPLGAPTPGESPGAAGPGRYGAASSPGSGYGEYDSIRSSDGGPVGPYRGGSGSYGAGGSGGSGGYGGGSGGSGPYGGGGSGDYGPGDYGSGGYGSRRKKKRSATALIGPMAGAVGLAVLLGVGVYAFAGTGGGCGGDDAITLNVATAPDIHPAIVKAATRFNDSKQESDGKCVKANITKSEPASVATLLSGQGVATGGNQRPDVWIPDTSLWTSMVTSSDKGGQAIQATKTSVASSPIVVGLPQTLAVQLKRQGVTATPSWDNLLKAAGGTAGGGVTKNQMISPGTVRLMTPDPVRNGAGMGALMVTSTLLTNDPNRESIFTGIVRTVRESTTPTVEAQFDLFRKGRTGKQPISLSSEQALWSYNKRGPAEPAVALYPVEGTLSMDYPVNITAGDAAKKKAARLFERAMGTEATRNDVRAQGFRSPDGRAPDGFNEKLGVSASRPRQLPAPKATQVEQVMQSWAKLSLGLRILTLIDVSGSMAERVGPNTNRLQAIAQVSQGGLSMMSDDTELGQWLFSTKMQGDIDYKESVSIGPLGERIGSITRRNLVLSQLQRMQPKMDGDTGLYDVTLAAYKKMSDTYKPEFVNSILLLTDGKNDDTNGPTLKQTLARLKRMQDPNKPIQVNMIGFGPGVDRNELEQIGKATGGGTAVAQTPQEISKIFLQMLSRRISN
ncbi:substrate-binding domain-containing protein [Actinomadura sp. 21ATH]|uniref:substrate-binding domain-containing protein n=1 Tax=Actinomadura sp. 21ATH TaxID=1735444 RepID=UPI0035BFE6A4